MVFFEQQLSNAIKTMKVPIFDDFKKTHESSSKNARFLKTLKNTCDFLERGFPSVFCH